MTKAYKEQVAEILRDSLHDFKITDKNELNNEIYFSRLTYFIELLEGSRKDAYYDGILDPKNKNRFISMRDFNGFDQDVRESMKLYAEKQTGRQPIVTVGIGANIESGEVRKQYDQVLKAPGLMQRVYDGKENLTQQQIHIIFKECIRTRLIRLKEIYGRAWDRLRANERICIHSLYFNNPSLANSNSKFHGYIKSYIKTNDAAYLKRAVEEVEKRSNKEKHDGIQNRRNAEGALLASYKAPTYVPSFVNAGESMPRVAELGKTVMPLRHNGIVSKDPIPGQDKNKNYFIWRTQMDGKVRPSHMMLEGKIFRYDTLPHDKLPGADCHCRCRYEALPHDVTVVENGISEEKAFTLYLRTGVVVSSAMCVQNRP